MSGAGAKRGLSREVLFAHLITNDLVFRNRVTTALASLGFQNRSIVSANKVAGTCKADVHIHFKNTNYLGCSVKAAQSNFNQLDRRWLSQWSAHLKMPPAIEQEIQDRLDLKMKNSREIFIPKNSSVIKFVKDNLESILKELFTKNEPHLELFVTYNENTQDWHAAKISDIIQYLSSKTIGTSKKGVIQIGNYLTLQRKGGDGNTTKPPKGTPGHPSNQLQFKIKPLTIIEQVRHYKI